MEAPSDTGPKLRELSDEEKAILKPMTDREARKVIDDLLSSMPELVIDLSDNVPDTELVARFVAIGFLRLNIPVVPTIPMPIEEVSLSAAS